MKIFTRHIGSYGGGPATIIQLTIEGNSSVIIEDITGLHCEVEEGFIQDLRDLADELEGQNNKVKVL